MKTTEQEGGEGMKTTEQGCLTIFSFDCGCEIAAWTKHRMAVATEECPECFAQSMKSLDSTIMPRLAEQLGKHFGLFNIRLSAQRIITHRDGIPCLEFERWKGWEENGGIS